MSRSQIKQQLRDAVVYGLNGKVPYKEGVKPGDMVQITGTFRVTYVLQTPEGDEVGVTSEGALSITEGQP